MNAAHKEKGKIFLLAELRYASVFDIVENGTGATFGTAVAVMDQDPDHSPMFFTNDNGVSFHRSTWKVQEFPFALAIIQTVDPETVEMAPESVAELRLALAKRDHLLASD